MTISFLPFPTSVVAEHLRSASASAAVDFYAFANLLISLAFSILLRAVIQEHPQSRFLLRPCSLKSLVGVGWCALCAFLALLIRIPFVSCRNRDGSDLYTPRPEPVFLLLAPLGFPGVFNTFQSESVSVRSLRFCCWR
ncbi:hypothetical protein DESA109040_00645 [Deinococcus saxicola]|uniref:hypothetical protein n=1 Tax=Deinococcus saxicola TaxID=249406 RepID=UPI0039EE2BF0